MTVGRAAPIAPRVASIPKFQGPQRENKKTKRQDIQGLFQKGRIIRASRAGKNDLASKGKLFP